MSLGYVAPTCIDEALAFLAQRGSDSSILAGGMSVVPALKRGRLNRKFIVNIKGLKDAPSPRPEVTHDTLMIGALVRHRDIETSASVAEHFPALEALERGLASIQIRNYGTLAGNLCAAEPWSDPPCLLAALDARLLVAAQHGRREVAAGDWIVGDGVTQQQPDEILLRIDISLLGDGEGIGYRRLAARQGLARPLACAAARIALDHNGTVAAARLFVGAVGARPQRMVQAETMLTGCHLTAELNAAIEASVSREVEQLPDERCGAPYKVQVAGVLARRAVADAVTAAKCRAH